MKTNRVKAERSAFTFLYGLIIFSTILLSACSKTPDEEQIQTVLEEVFTAIEAGKPMEMARHLHKDFMANNSMDIKQIKQLLLMHNMQHAKISITPVSKKTEIDPVYTDSAVTEMSVIITGSSARGMPEDGSIRVINLEWRKDGDWKILSAQWK